MVVAKHAQLDYDVVNLGLLSNSEMGILMQGPAVPIAELAMLGVTLTSDLIQTAVVGPPATMRRRITLLFQNTAATATASVVGGSGAVGPIEALTLTGNGSTYAAPPIVQISETAAGVTPTAKAQAHATLNVDAINVTAGGGSYTGATTVTLVGGLRPGGVAATATPTIGGGGAITGISVVTPGGPYQSPPTVVIADTGGGSGATAVADLQVGALVLDNPGAGYLSPSVTIIDLFDYTWPAATADQRQPFYNLMTNAIRAATSSPVQAIAPVLIP